MSFFLYKKSNRRMLQRRSTNILLRRLISASPNLKPHASHARIFLSNMKEFAKVLIVIFCSTFVNLQRTILDEKFLPLLRSTLQFSISLVRPKSFEISVERAIKNKKVQQQFSDDFPFFCNLTNKRSEITPRSVHELRPGDIDIIGALGDSTLFGTGALAVDPAEFFLEGRGVSFPIGGQKTWRQFLTIPNILKEFNPKLYGYSLTGNGGSTEKTSKFNAAENGVRNERIF